MIGVGPVCSLVFGIAALGGALRIAWVAVPKAEWGDIATILRDGRRNSSLSLQGAMGRLVFEVEKETDPSARIDRVAEQMALVDFQTRDCATRVGMWVRVSFFSGAACSIAELCVALGHLSTRRAQLDVVLPFFIGAVFGIAAAGVGRWAGVAGLRRRLAWERLCDAGLRPLMARQMLIGNGNGFVAGRNPPSAGGAYGEVR